ncbi:hypothetical protein ACHAWF_002558, partial [Thalassiosira exigua]
VLLRLRSLPGNQPPPAPARSSFEGIENPPRTPAPTITAPLIATDPTGKGKGEQPSASASASASARCAGTVGRTDAESISSHIIKKVTMAATAFLLLFVLLCSWSAQVVNSSIPRSSVGPVAPSHPSTALAGDTTHNHHRPAWNASPQINDQGYLCKSLYQRTPGEWEADCRHTSTGDLAVPVIIRQVPGDGDCLFHAVAISLNLIESERHLRMDSQTSLWQLKDMSRQLRKMAVECLRSCSTSSESKRGRAFLRPRKQLTNDQQPGMRKSRKYKRLFIQGYESMSTSQLLSTAASQYGISPEEYCDLMEQDSYWGGGPEIVALCNILRRPIHVYELVATSSKSDENSAAARDSYTKIQVPDHLMSKQFCLRRMATFGSPKYDSKAPLHILSADSRFPDVKPCSIRENGNHFMALFPLDIMRKWVNTTTCVSGHQRIDPSDRKRRVRGGAASTVGNYNLMMEEESGEEETWLFHGEWFDDFDYSTPLEGMHGWAMIDQSPSLRVSKRWQHKVLSRTKKESVGKGNQLAESTPRHSMKHVLEFWINIFVWTLSHFHIGF